jgi:hypothetical protein
MEYLGKRHNRRNEKEKQQQQLINIITILSYTHRHRQPIHKQIELRNQEPKRGVFSF